MTNSLEYQPKLSGSRCAILTIVVFALAEESRSVLYGVDGYASFVRSLPTALDFAEQPLRWTLIVLAALWIGQRINPLQALTELGMRGGVVRGLFFSLVATLPMAIVPLFVGSLNPKIDPLWVFFSATIWPLGEEILFRGYLFRQLYRRANWGFWPAALASSIIFGAVHLTSAAIQRQPFVEQFGAIAMIAVLSIVGAWVFVRWDDNLWVMFGLHGFMNLWWAVFELGETALGGVLGNVARLAAVALAIAITLYRTPIEKRLTRALGRADANRSDARQTDAG